jgi:ADP-ribosylation factor GTPase-activating protein 2/3
MKTGGNESATKYFQSHGGAAALASKDPKTKYTSNAANKYKDELARRVDADQKKHVTTISLRAGESMADNFSGTPTVWL